MTAHLIGYEIACDGPTGQGDCPHSAAVRARFTSRTARQVRDDGRRDGWKARPGGLDICPACATPKAPRTTTRSRSSTARSGSPRRHPDERPHPLRH